MWELKGSGDGRDMPWLSDGDGFLWFIITISNSYYVVIKILGNELTSILAMLFDFIILYLIHCLDCIGRKTIPLIIFVVIYSTHNFSNTIKWFWKLLNHRLLIVIIRIQKIILLVCRKIFGWSNPRYRLGRFTGWNHLFLDLFRSIY